ncbi:MAG: discoidin domain-containing protein, partial [Candidatus Omnitrophica bacterium]|nr:discoidin domain-containing protein [Candidatus Omnitrophota bacterium]
LLGAATLFGWPMIAALSHARAADAPNSPPVVRELENSAYRLRVAIENDQVQVRLEDKLLNLRAADGPYLYRAKRLQGQQTESSEGLQNPMVLTWGNEILIRGELAGLEVEHHFVVPTEHPWLEERIVVRNPTDSMIALTNFEAGLRRVVTDSSGQVLPEFAQDRWVAVPLRARATDPKGYVNDFSVNDLITKPGYEPWVDKDQHYIQAPSPHRRSEGWAWVHGDGTLGIFVFNQENMLFSVVTPEKVSDATALVFGGACMISNEPAALGRISPGESVDLGTVRYESMKGGYVEAMYAYRDLLDEKGCRFPADFNPPVHWEQLYDMSGAWEDRAHRYTKAIVEKEAAKGKAYSCEALYLDPGWDTDFGTFLWGEQWLGPQKAFVDEMKSKYGLELSLHCPLATWMSHQYSWGLGAVKTWPQDAVRIPPPAEDDHNQVERLQAPAVRNGHRNLALLPDAKANASSVYDQGSMPIHQIAHLNDGWYGNSASWISESMPAWAEIDLGGVYHINQVILGNDHTSQFADRATTSLRILTATEYNPDSSASTWQTVLQYRGEPILTEKAFSFASTAARWVRIEILPKEEQTAQIALPRLDEIEVYEADPVTHQEAESYAKLIKRGVCFGRV